MRFKEMDIIISLLLLYLRSVFGEDGTPLFSQVRRISEELGIPIQHNDFPDDFPILPEYDFVVVGSGPAGSTVASRLSEIKDWNVLLIEAGDEGTIYNDIPAFNEYTVLTNTAEIFQTERDSNACLGIADDGRCYWANGRGVGGGSIINGMLYTRGHPSDYDSWAFEGNEGWSYKEVLPYFLKFENMTIPGLAESPFHSTTGPVHIQYPFQTEIARRFLVAAQELGYNLVDYNNPNTMNGFSQSQITTNVVRRDSAVTAYLMPANARPNFHLLKKAYVTEVLTNYETKRVYGVNFVKNGVKRSVFAKREVILSAGAFGSPKILMLSGIGPAEHLRQLGIPAIINLPVGDNLQEHLATSAVTFLINSTDSVTLPKQLATIESDYVQWLNGINGSLANNIPEALGYIKTKFATHRPDIELLLVAGTVAGDGGVFWRRTRNVSIEVFEKTWGPILYREGFNLFPMVMYPKSRGNVRLRSCDPNDQIIINGNFLSDPFDIRVMIEGVRAAIRMTETNAFQEIGATLYSNPVYGCESHPFNSDDYWECAIRTVPFQLHHQSGTCSMGTHPSSSVVDPRLKVHGLAGLRVADASVMSITPGIHTMAPCYMIGEKAADMIKQDWGAATHHGQW